MLGIDRASAREDRGPFDRVGQLANVARPIVRLKCGDGFGVRAESRSARRPESQQHMFRQRRDIPFAFAKRGRWISNVLIRKNKSSRNCSASIISRRSRLVAQKDPDIDAERVVLADAADLTRLEEAEELDLNALVELADLVEKRVPPLATSKSPLRWVSAPVNDPLRWPNNSLSTRFSGKAPQLTGMKLCERACFYRAGSARSSSLPVPVSPRIITLASVSAIVVDQAADREHRRGCRRSGSVRLRHSSAGSRRGGLVRRGRARSLTRLRITSSLGPLHGLVR